MCLQKSLKYEILQWLQTNYGGRKLGEFLGIKNQWLVSSYFLENSSTLVLGTAIGKKEARILNPGGFEFHITVNQEDLASFQEEFKKLIS